jgi:hypothetical protein
MVVVWATRLALVDEYASQGIGQAIFQPLSVGLTLVLALYHNHRQAFGLCYNLDQVPIGVARLE